MAASGALEGIWLIAGVLLIARDVVVAALGEALPGELDIRVSAIERVKIALQFTGLGLLIAPSLSWAIAGESHDLGRWGLVFSAALACVTTFDYGLRAFRKLTSR